MADDIITIDNKLTKAESDIKDLFNKKTPKAFIKQKPGPGGMKLPYVPIDYVLSELNRVFGIFWEFVIEDVRFTPKQVIVRGKLVVKAPNNFSVSRPGIGRANIKFYKGTQDPVDEGNDEKAATSDAIKKAASLFGIAADVYYKELEKYEDLNVQSTKEEDDKKVAMSRYFAVTNSNGIEAEEAKKKIKAYWNVAHMADLTIKQMESFTKAIEIKFANQKNSETDDLKKNLKATTPPWADKERVDRLIGNGRERTTGSS